MKNLPQVIVKLVEAQANFESKTYAQCFSENAVVFDEGKTHKGRKEIEIWIEKANKEYQLVMKPIEYSEVNQTLKAKISGTFPGSPIVLQYKFDFENQLIKSLKIDS